MDDIYDSSSTRNSFASPPMYGDDDPFAEASSSSSSQKQPQQGGSESNLGGKRNKIKMVAPVDMPFVVEGLKKVYKSHISPAEEKYKFSEFSSSTMRAADFEAKPMVLLMGQYSVGKTTFIEYLLERSFPGSRIGPEPTTDRFVCVMHGEEDRIIPGNALSVDASKPFHGANRFGTGFLSKFEAAVCTAPLLQQITLIDTPGILSGEKQRIGRTYDFHDVLAYFADKCDMILLLFDAHKLDISDEFKKGIQQLRGHDDKIRVVLNKADQVSTQQLMRIYGALMWSLGKVVNSPEVMRVYIGSFWDAPYKNEENAKLFRSEQEDLLRDLQDMPRNSAIRKVNELVKRTRAVKAHAYIISHLKEKMPALFGKEKAKEELMNSLPEQFQTIARMYKLPPGDFPPIEALRTYLQDYDFSKFNKLDEKVIAKLDEALSIELPKLMNVIQPAKNSGDVHNPFAEPEVVSKSGKKIRWDVPQKEQERYVELFRQLPSSADGAATGADCRGLMVKSGLPQDVLRDIWALCDIEKNGKLDEEEFILCMHLCKIGRDGKPIPTVLSPTMIPPSKR